MTSASNISEILQYALRISVSIAPVFLFLIALVFLDSYKLVSLRRIIETLLLGGLVAIACYFINQLGFQVFRSYYPKFGAPVVEELLKAAYIIYLTRAGRIGFMVDGAIYGFAIGAGFALIENIYYLQAFAVSNPLVWVVRGLGTAVMHGGTTAIVGTIASSFAEQQTSSLWSQFFPGLGIAIVVHSFFNLSLLPPMISTVLVLIGLPTILALVFVHSEKSLQDWLGKEFDRDVELLSMMAGGQFSATPAGTYLKSLKSSFPPQIVGDMLSLVHLSLELNVRAKADLMMREAGFPVSADPSLNEKFQEVNYLEKSIGRTGMMALAPLLSGSARDLWQMHMLKEVAGEGAAKA